MRQSLSSLPLIQETTNLKQKEGRPASQPMERRLMHPSIRQGLNINQHRLQIKCERERSDPSACCNHHTHIIFPSACLPVRSGQLRGNVVKYMLSPLTRVLLALEKWINPGCNQWPPGRQR